MPFFYYIIVFDDGTELIWCDYLAELTEEHLQGKTIKCVLYGTDDYFGEFVPRNCFKANGDEDKAELLVQMIARGMQSRNLQKVAVSAIVMKYLLKEIKP